MINFVMSKANVQNHHPVKYPRLANKILKDFISPGFRHLLTKHYIIKLKFAFL